MNKIQNIKQIFKDTFNEINHPKYLNNVKKIYYYDFKSFFNFVDSFDLNSKKNILHIGTANIFELLTLKILHRSAEQFVVNKDSQIINHELVNGFILSEIENLDFQKKFDLIIFRHFPFNQDNTSKVLNTISKAVKNKTHILASFYYKHEYQNFVKNINNCNWNITYQGENPNALFFNEQERKQCNESTIILNPIAKEIHYEISKRDKWFALVEIR